jgi:hypothetical protein
MFGVNVSDSESLKLAIGQAVIDKIQDRTESGIGLNGKGFRRYSKQYKSSDDFRAAGKTDQVNLRLSGDMLELMDITEQSSNTITIGWDDSEDAAKAHGHITGSSKGPRVKRDFFGLRSSDIEAIKSEFSSEIKEIKQSRGDNREEAILALARKLMSDGEN